MDIRSSPDVFTKMTQMGDLTLYEPAGDSPQSEGKTPPKRFQATSLADCISNVATPQGNKPIMKVMQTTACERNCYYCFFRAGRSKTPRLSFKPDEMAGAFDTLHRAKQVDGIFLSSGIIKGSVTSQDKIIDTAELIRGKYGYKGYVHLKIMPGAEYDQLHRAMQLADRVSVNLEGATEERLALLAPKKDYFGELLQMLQWADQIRRNNPHQKLASTVTQFVVGAVGDTDLELLSITDRLYKQLHLSRTYFMSFGPVEQTPFENLPATDKLREHRLYQASFLLRDYGWGAEDLPFNQNGHLPMDADPKQVWAEQNLSHAPIEVMTADREQLLRIPGIGLKAAEAIIKARRNGQLHDLSQLRKLGIRAPERAAPYILMAGRRLPVQKKLF